MAMRDLWTRKPLPHVFKFDMREFLNTEQGKELLGYLMEKYHVRSTTAAASMDAVMVDAHLTMLHEGERRVVLELIRMATISDEELTRLATRPQEADV